MPPSLVVSGPSIEIGGAPLLTAKSSTVPMLIAYEKRNTSNHVTTRLAQESTGPGKVLTGGRVAASFFNLPLDLLVVGARIFVSLMDAAVRFPALALLMLLVDVSNFAALRRRSRELVRVRRRGQEGSPMPP